LLAFVVVGDRIGRRLVFARFIRLLRRLPEFDASSDVSHLINDKLGGSGDRTTLNWAEVNLTARDANDPI